MMAVFAFIMLALTFNSCAQTSVTVIRRPPAASRVVVYSGVRYHYHAGVYYKPYGNKYVVVRPPVGLFVSVLPVGYTTVTFGNVPYFVAGGVYYVRRSPNQYEVVEAPQKIENQHSNELSASNVSSLPPGTQQVIINDKRYYKVNDTYYEKLISENGAESFVIVGNVR